MSRETRGLWLGTLGVVIFALTLPMTRLATGSVAEPQLSGVFIAMGRAAVAGLLSLTWLLATRAARPRESDWRLLLLIALGTVFGFPLCASIALRYVESVHASVMLGVLPLGTAVLAAWVHRQHPSWGFWLCAVLGAVLVLSYPLLRAGSDAAVAATAATRGIRGIHWADLLLLLAMVCAAFSYVSGAQLTARMSAVNVICWALVLSLPITLPAALWLRPSAPVALHAWAGFAYLSLFSMWIGFFAWYRGLALGGTVRVSQVQLIQPFLSMVFSIPLLGEHLDALTITFGLAVMLTVGASRFMSVQRKPAAANALPATR